MCRLAAYLGPEIFLSSLVTEPLKGDGFGLSSSHTSALPHAGAPHKLLGIELFF